MNSFNLSMIFVVTVCGIHCLSNFEYCPKVCECSFHARGVYGERTTDCKNLNETSLNEVLKYFENTILKGFMIFRNLEKFFVKRVIRNSKMNHISHHMCTVNFEGFSPSISLSLILAHNRIQKLTGRVLWLEKCVRIYHLDLSFNQIDHIETNYFRNSVELEYLNLSNNAIKSTEAFPVLPGKLNYLDFSNNTISLLDSEFIIEWARITTNREVDTVLNISFNKIDRLEKKDILNRYKTQLKVIGKYKNNIIDLSYNRIQAISVLGYAFYYFVRYKNSQNFHINIHNNPIICDCAFYRFDRNLSKQLSVFDAGNYYDFEKVTCANLNRMPITDISFNMTECNGKYCEQSRKCSCNHIPIRETLQMVCEGVGFRSLPEIIYPDLYESIEVYLANNTIERLTNTLYMPKVTRLDLRSNRISKWELNITRNFRKMMKLLLQNNKLQTLPGDIATFCKYQSDGGAVIYVKHNPILCDCTNHKLRTWLSQLGSCVADKRELLCHGYFNKGLKFLDVPLSNFVCTWFNPKALAIALTMLALIIVTMLSLMYIWRRYLYFFLFTRFGIRLGYDYDILGEGKEYDIFISYCNLDEDRANEVVKFLEEYNPPFRVCLHYRDFIPGEPVIDNIARCIEISKCTLMLVSKNFINSSWCNYEFKMAHHGAIEEKKNKLVVVLLEEVDGAKADLNLYLKTNTYLEMADPQFHSRLLLALPHPCGKRNSIGL